MKNIYRTFRALAVLCLLLTLFVVPVLASASLSPALQEAPPADNLAPLIVLLGGSGFLIMVILAVVEWIKKTALPAKYWPYASMLVGLVAGVAFMAYRSPLKTFADWFLAVLYGIILGLIASGLFSVGASLAKKAAPPDPPLLEIRSSPDNAQIIRAVRGMVEDTGKPPA